MSREQRQEWRWIKASKPKPFFIPKSSVTIPAYKADCKQGHLQAKQPFPCHMDSNCQSKPSSGDRIIELRLPCVRKKYIFIFLKILESHITLSLGYCVEVPPRCVSDCKTTLMICIWFEASLEQLHASQGVLDSDLNFANFYMCNMYFWCNKSC